MRHAISSSSSLYERVRFMRWGSAVERVHILPHLLRYSNGHHTHDLISILIICWKATHGGALPRAELLVAAHVHDKGEGVTGDIPSPIKDLLGERLKGVDLAVEDWLDCAYPLTDEEAEYLHAADRLELYIWCLEEWARGNQTFTPWIQRMDKTWAVKPLPQVFMDLHARVKLSGVPALSWDELAEIGGLS